MQIWRLTLPYEIVRSGRLNSTIIGIGEFGCSILESIVNMRVANVLTLAISTNENYNCSRHPAARALALDTKNCKYELAMIEDWLVDSNLNIFIFDDDLDVGLVEHISSQIVNKDDNCKNIAIIPPSMNQISKTEVLLNNFNAVISTLYDTYYDAKYIICHYVSTLFRVIYDHAVIGIEYTDLINVLDSKLHYISYLSKESIDVSEMTDKLAIFQNNRNPKLSFVIICFECSVMVKNEILDVIDRIHGKSDTKYLFSIVPDNNLHSFIDLTIIGFEVKGV